MSRRPRSLGAAVAVTVVLATAGCADVTSPGVEVNGVSFDRSEVNDLVEDLTADPLIADRFGGTVAGTADQTAVNQIVTALILDVLIVEELAVRGQEVTDGDRADAVTAVEGAGYSGTRIESWLTGIVAAQNAFSRVHRETGEDPNATATALVLGADVSVDPRYGRWNSAQGQLDPPAAPASEGTQGLQLGN